jgi:hypothetical protein
MIANLKDNLNLWGFAPVKLPVKFGIAPSSAPKILANSIPKSGTHLLERLLYLLPGLSRQFARTFSCQKSAAFARRCARLKRGQFLVSHLFYHEEHMQTLRRHGIKPILLIRDPRDIVLSNVSYITRKNRKHRLHAHFVSQLKTDQERLHFCIRGSNHPPELPLSEVLEKFHSWMQTPDVLVVRFEDLIGEAGGGSAAKQRQNIESILDFIGVQPDQKLKQSLMQKLFHRGSKTFNKGQINQWKTRFDEEDKRVFKEVAGDWLIKYGYENDFNW